jgi:hypothetical protein
MTEMEQEKRVSLNADVMIRRALDLKEDNVLIAKFMGGVLSSVPNLINLPQTRGDANIHSVKGSEVLPNGTYSVHRLSELKYHSSWDWLMPVVIVVGGNGNLLAAMKNLRPYGVLRTIEDTHQAVVKFINQLKTK